MSAPPPPPTPPPPLPPASNSTAPAPPPGAPPPLKEEGATSKPTLFEHESYELQDGNKLTKKDPKSPQTIEELESLNEALATYIQVRSAGSQVSRLDLTFSHAFSQLTNINSPTPCRRFARADYYEAGDPLC